MLAGGRPIMGMGLYIYTEVYSSESLALHLPNKSRHFQRSVAMDEEDGGPRPFRIAVSPG